MNNSRFVGLCTEHCGLGDEGFRLECLGRKCGGGHRVERGARCLACVSKDVSKLRIGAKSR